MICDKCQRDFDKTFVVAADSNRPRQKLCVKCIQKINPKVLSKKKYIDNRDPKTNFISKYQMLNL